MTRIAFAIAAVLTAGAVGWVWYARGPKPTSAGTVEYPSEIDLGEFAPGREIVAEVPIRNTSAGPIRVSDFHTSCGCMMAGWRGSDGRVEPLGEATLNPGDAAVVAVVTHTPVGATGFAHRLTFRTDHPAVTETSVLIRGRVRVGVVATPGAVAFDPVYPGETSTATVRVADLRAAADRTPLRLDSDYAAVRVTAVGPAPDDATAYEVMLALTGGRPGPVAGRVVVSADGGVVLGTVPFSGRVAPVVELVPSVVVLPRTGSPDPNEARVEARARTPVRFIVDDVPVGLTVRVDAGALVVRRTEPGGPGVRLVRARARTADDRDYPVTLSVACSE